MVSLGASVLSKLPELSFPVTPLEFPVRVKKFPAFLSAVRSSAFQKSLQFRARLPFATL
jgi:hypothetical protein